MLKVKQLSLCSPKGHVVVWRYKPLVYNTGNFWKSGGGRGVKRSGRDVDTHPHLAPKLQKG